MARRLSGPRPPSLVQVDPTADRALVWVVAILALLAGLCAGLAHGAAEAASAWSSSLAAEATVQIRPSAGRNIEADLAEAAALARADPAVAEARVMSRAEAEELLTPWLGRGLDLGTLPVPRMIVLRLAAAGAPLGRLADRLRSLPGASLDDHGTTIRRLSTAADAVAAIGAAIVLLVLAASGLAIAFATRGTLAGSREVVEVLGVVGADDRFVAAAFASHFLRLGLRGAAAGGGIACLLLLLPHLATGGDPAGGGPGDLLRFLALGPRGAALIVAVAGAMAATARLASGAAVRGFLRGMGRG